MVIMTAKVSKRKMLLVLLLLVLAAAVLITCLKRADTPDTSQDTAEEIAEVATNEARVAFLEQFGWTVAEEPVQTQKVRVPEDPSEVFLRYNDLQLSQGYDLLSYSGKTLTRYVYQITNYPGTDGVYFATLLVYNDNVVGGDVASSRQNGVMHGFAMPQAQTTGLLPVTDGEEISDNYLNRKNSSLQHAISEV